MGNLGREIWGWILGKDKTFFRGFVGVLCCFSIVAGLVMRDGNELLGAEGFYCF